MLLERVIYCFLRHDHKFSVPIARRVAKIENELDNRAIYLVQGHSEF